MHVNSGNRLLDFGVADNLTEIDDTAQKMKFSIKDFFSKCDQIRSFLWIWSHLLKKSLMENIFWEKIDF